jgi:hypothetical protein
VGTPKVKTRRRFFYLRLAGCEDSVLLKKHSDSIRSTLGAVRDSGLGTAKDPKSAWIELGAKDHVQTIADVRQGLSMLVIDVPEIVEIDRGEGPTQARQLDLFAGAS